jgi:hypothetical protein
MRRNMKCCTADPIVADSVCVTIPGLRRIIPLRSMLRRARETGWN